MHPNESVGVEAQLQILQTQLQQERIAVTVHLGVVVAGLDPYHVFDPYRHDPVSLVGEDAFD